MSSDEAAVEATATPTEDAVAPAQAKAWIQAVSLAVSLLTTIIETFGWPGTVLIFVLFFIVEYATDAQKQEIIDKYVLGKGIAAAWPIILLVVLFTAVAWAQHKWYAKRLDQLVGEVEREGKEKSRLQEKLLGKQLQHTKPKHRKTR